MVPGSRFLFRARAREAVGGKERVLFGEVYHSPPEVKLKEAVLGAEWRTSAATGVLMKQVVTGRVKGVGDAER
jgi:hypothetical protein